MATAQHNAKLIRDVLRISIDAYNNVVLEEGLRYLDLYMGGDNIGREVLRDMPDYWAWWNRAFHIRNARFIAEHELDTYGHKMDRWERSQYMHLFNEMHSAEMLRIRPSRKITRNAIDTVRKRLHMR